MGHSNERFLTQQMVNFINIVIAWQPILFHTLFDLMMREDMIR